MATAQTWHLHLGHLHSWAMVSLNKQKLISINDVGSMHKSCDECCITKSHKIQHKIQHKSRMTIYYVPLELILVDVWGMTQVYSTI